MLLAASVTAVAPAEAAAGDRIVLVAGNSTPPRGDRAILARLQATGLPVDIVDDNDLPVSLEDVALIAVSTSVNRSVVGDSLDDVLVPVLTWEPLMHSQLGLADGPAGENTSSRSIRIVDASHPIAAGFSGVTTVVRSSQRMSYGTPPPSAEVIAVTHNRASRAVLYTIAAGDLLADGSEATACRTALFPNYAGAQVLSAAGQTIVDAAIDHTLSCGVPGGPIDVDGDGYSPPADCDDDDPAINPGAEEVANDGIDQDCDGSDLVVAVDVDGDGYSPPADCDDGDPGVNPGAVEVSGDGIDQDCDGSDLVAAVDVDGDGYSPPADCDDDDPGVNPGALDVPGDGIDQDCNGEDSAELKNVVLIMTDDMSLADLAYMPKARALIGDQGATFTNAFTNNPLCCPTRATILTGQRSANHGVQSNRSADGTGGYPKLDHSNTLATWADAQGFTTAHIGKFFNGYGQFDYVPGVNNLLEVPPGWNDWQSFTRTIKAFQYKINDNGSKVQYRTAEEDYYTDVVADRAVETIQESVAADRPLFLWASIHAPHGVKNGPAVPAPRHENAFDGVALPQTPNFDEADVSDKPQWLQDTPQLTAAEISTLRVKHEARIESLLAADDLVEDIYQALADGGILNETLLIFTSDNGFLLGEHRWFGKQVPYEGSIRVPLLVRGGPFGGGKTVDGLVSNLDLLPTMLTALDVAPQLTLDGIDVTSAIADPELLDNRALIIESFDAPTPYMAVRTEHWIWVEYDSGERELYDLVNDPYQLESRHDDPSYQSERAQLQQALSQLRACAGSAACDVRLDLPPKS